MNSKANIESLLQLARSAQKNSHSPYSHVQVGSAVLLENGKIFSGTNIENASFGGTVCAERVAIWKAISEMGSQKIAEISVVSPSGWPPCGLCRQVLSEFATPGTLIHVGDETQHLKTYLFSELMPDAFGPTHLSLK